MIFGNMKPPLGVQLNYCHPLARGLVGCWLMNEGCGNQIFDLSGNGNTGIFSGNTSWAAGKFGTCLSFAGDGYVDLGLGPIKGLPQLTISAWVKNNLSVSTSQAILEQTGAGNDLVVLYWSTSEKYTFSLYNDAQVSATSVTDTAFTDQQWHHIVGTYNGSIVQIYADVWTKDSTPGSLTGNLEPAPGTNLAISFNGGGTGDEWNGLIDNIMMWNRALSEAEIRLLYREPFCMFEEGL